MAWSTTFSWHADPNSNSTVASSLRALDSALLSGGSALTVVDEDDGTFRLGRRIPSATVSAAREVIENSGRAGELLANAWSKIYGRNPDPSAAYHEAIRAVEAAARPLVLPNDSLATLGKDIGEMKNNPEKWKVALSSNDGGALERVVGMMQLLWQGQHDRHGTPDDSLPLNVSPSEAQAAVHLATTLVQWFTDGVIERVST